MKSQQEKKLRVARGMFMFGPSIVLAAAGMLISVLVPSLTKAASAEGKHSLQQLIEAARKEGQLDLMITSSQGEKGARELTSAFRQRFGLEIRTNADVSGQESQKFNQARAETRSGIVPTFDLMAGQAENVLGLMEAGGAEAIERWEVLLAGIDPQAHKVKEAISPQILAGHGLLSSTRTVALLYNPRLISQPDLPKTWKEMGNPKYREAFSVPPWTDVVQMGLLKFDREEVLRIARSWGSNKRHVLTYSAAVQRMVLGELKFLYGNAQHYFEYKANDANAPIGISFFEDLTTHSKVMYVVRKGARHPHAAKLFALWATSTQANRLFEKYGYLENLALGTGPISKAIGDTLKERNIRPVSWFDSPESIEKLRWLETAEGKEFNGALAKALKEGK